MTVIQSVMDVETGEPQDDLLPEAKALIGKLGSSCTKVSEVVANKDEKVYSEITAGLERANKHAVSHAQKVKQQFVEYFAINFILTALFFSGRFKNSLFWRRTSPCLVVS